jgi:hypothetical protein
MSTFWAAGRLRGLQSLRRSAVTAPVAHSLQFGHPVPTGRFIADHAGELDNGRGGGADDGGPAALGWAAGTALLGVAIIGLKYALH